MSRQSGKKLTGVFAAALLATLGVGTLPAIAAQDGVAVQSVSDNMGDDGHDGDHDGDHHDGDHDGDHHDGDHHDGDHHDGDHHDGDHHKKHKPQPKPPNGGKHEGKDDGKKDDGKKEDGKKDDGKKDDGKKDDGKHEGKHKGKHKNAFRLATSDGKKCVEASGKLERCKHDDPDQLWFRKDGDSTGWRLVNVGEKTCLGAHPGKDPDIKQEKCTDSLRQKWIPFGGPGMEKAPFVNAKFRSEALGRDSRVELTDPGKAPKWQWLLP